MTFSSEELLRPYWNLIRISSRISCNENN